MICATSCAAEDALGSALSEALCPALDPQGNYRRGSDEQIFGAK
jgi:hypothetical protein